jgi:hypothetical protein
MHPVIFGFLVLVTTGLIETDGFFRPAVKSAIGKGKIVFARSAGSVAEQETRGNKHIYTVNDIGFGGLVSRFFTGIKTFLGPVQSDIG